MDSGLVRERTSTELAETVTLVCACRVKLAYAECVQFELPISYCITGEH